MQERLRVVLLTLSALALIFSAILGFEGLQSKQDVSHEFGDRRDATVVAPEPKVSTADIPIRIRVPALSLSAPILAVQKRDAITLDVPSDIRTVGWYSSGVSPGSASGSAVLVGHRDGSGGSVGIFWRLGSLEMGDRIEVLTRSGGSLIYKVIAAELLNHPELQQASPDLFATLGNPRLTLITCGGSFERDLGGYQANIVVTAVPVSA
jgi:sortase (surface protein transpeptidase)